MMFKKQLKWMMIKKQLRLKSSCKIIHDEEGSKQLNSIPLATKPPTIVDWKIHKEGKKTITRSSEMMEVQRSKYGSTRPVEDLDLILWGDLKTMFEPHVEDRVGVNQHDYSRRKSLKSKGSIPTKTVGDANIAIQENGRYSQKWHNKTSHKSQEKVNKKVYAASGLDDELCKGHKLTKDCPHYKDEGNTLERGLMSHSLEHLSTGG
ncbi:hypothetical protein Tco_0088748 [Tanacetum coccineum]